MSKKVNIIEAREANKTKPVIRPDGYHYDIGEVARSDYALRAGNIYGEWTIVEEPREVKEYNAQVYSQSEVDTTLNAFAEAGWALVSILPAMPYHDVAYYMVVFERSKP